MQKKFATKVFAFILVFTLTFSQSGNIFAINSKKVKLPNVNIKNIIVMILGGNNTGTITNSAPAATILEGANILGKSTGIVTVSNIQHETPATFSSHCNNCNFYDIIAEQQVYNDIDVVMGGGSMYLDPSYRKDGENLIDIVKDMGYHYVTTKDDMNKVRCGKLWGMFANDVMDYDIDRSEKANTQPSLAEMTTKAINLLSQNDEGFFLMVEGSKTDDAAVEVAVNYAKASDNTMLLIMKDHGTGDLYTYHSDDQCIIGTLENTDIGKICAGIWGIDLAELTKELYVEAEPAFTAKGAKVGIDTSAWSSGVMTVTKGNTTLCIYENKNYVIINNIKVELFSVIVNQSGKFYVPQCVIDLIP